MIEIDRMKESDLEMICSIENENFTSPWSKKSFRETIRKENTIYLTAKEKDEVIGYCGLWKILDEGEITNVSVSREHRGKQVGRLLLQALLDGGSAEGVTTFHLEVRKSNIPAISLYRKCGFRITGERRDFYEKPKENALLMQKVNT